MPGIMSQTKAVEVKVQAMSPAWYCEATSDGSVVEFMVDQRGTVRTLGEGEVGWMQGARER